MAPAFQKGRGWVEDVKVCLGLYTEITAYCATSLHSGGRNRNYDTKESRSIVNRD